MAKSSRGGKAGSSSFTTIPTFAAAAQPAPQPKPQPIPQPVIQPTPQPVLSADFDAFKKMTDDQKADAIIQAAKTPVPVFLAQNDLQKVLYGLKLNDKPTLVDDSVLDSMPGKDLFRTINDAKDQTYRIKYSATDVANQVIRGSVTRVSDTGGSVHGRGIYFADSYRSSTVYGKMHGDISKTAVIRAKLSPSAKTISTNNAAIGVANEISSGTKLGKALSKIHYTDRTAIWSLAKGYDAMVASNGYHVVVNRSALVASKTINAMGNSWK